jgi:hypothetical protein
LPTQASRVLTQMESGGLVVQSPQVTREIHTLGRSVDHLTSGIIFAAFLVSGAMLLNSGNIQLGEVLLGAAGATLLWAVFGGGGRN